MKNKLFLLTLVLFVAATGCKDDFLDTVPENTISNEQLAANPSALSAIISGVYANLRTFGVGGSTRHVDYGLRGAHAGLDMMSHDVSMSIFHWYGFFYNYDSRVQTSSRTEILWNTYYTQVAETNSVINAINKDTDDPDARAILGQALALRALFTFNAARMYAHTYIGHENDQCVPMPNGESFDGKPRATVQEVFTQIVADLEGAIPLLADFAKSTNQELDQAVAQGILARVYLEMGEWTKAAENAAAARAGKMPMTPDQWMAGFSDISNPEVMWGADIDAESSTVFASFFSHFDNTNNGYAGALGVYKVIDASLYDQISDTDIRKGAFVDPVNGNEDYPVLPAYANIKFRDATFFEGDYIYMRVAEMYLIEAEAKARMGDANAAQVLFDLVSTKDPSYTLSTATGDALVEEVYLQRRIELWGEGFAWFDLKRLKKPLVRDYPGTNHATFSAIQNLPAEDDKFRFQIPEDEINANEAINAADQNPL
ncbi:MAG: RagB/SusD family nutrient uptake outer membrane protein [Bacteroidota bacterium]